MTSLAQKLFAAAAAASLTLSASPAFARGLELGVDGSVGVHASSDHASADASMKTDAHGTRRGWRFGTFLEHKATVEHDDEKPRHTVEQLEARFDAMIKRSTRAMAAVAKRVCMNNEVDSVQSCLDGIASHIKASFSAAVDATFTVETQ